MRLVSAKAAARTSAADRLGGLFSAGGVAGEVVCGAAACTGEGSTVCVLAVSGLALTLSLMFMFSFERFCAAAAT